MPLLVNKLIFGLVSERAPFILRPILRSVFGKLTGALINPRLKRQAAFVSISQHHVPPRPLTTGLLRSRTICQKAGIGSLVDKVLHLATS